MPDLNPANLARLRALQAKMLEPAPVTPTASHQQLLLHILAQAEQAAGRGNPVRAQQHVRRAIQFLKDHPLP